MTDPKPQGRIAAVDYGTVRMGVAITDPQRQVASPLATHHCGGRQADARFFRRLAEEEQIAEFVVGLPVHLSGEESQKSYEARQFAGWLHETTGVPVVLFDERFTTHQADELLRSAEMTRKKRKGRRDMLAAYVLLTSYLESHGRGTTDPGPLDDEQR